jgi:hypothetical protein
MGEKIALNAGFVTIPENRFWEILCWLPRKLAGTQSLDHKYNSLIQHISAMTDIFHIILADVSGNWTSDKRERVQRMIANFTLVNEGLSTVKAKGNPFTEEELRRLRSYTQQAQEGRLFTPDQAIEYKELSERASREYPGQQWVTELLKVALFIFALYALTQLLKPKA